MRAVFARRQDPYAGGDVAMARRFTLVMWPAGTLVMLALLPFYPPTEATGAAGWLAPAISTAVVAAILAWIARNPERLTYNHLYLLGWIGLVSVTLTQWLAGGRSSPYHELFLLQIIGTGLLHPPRRFVLFLAGVVGAAYLPLAYAPDGMLLGEVATELLLWMGIGAFLVVLMRRIRDQRLALQRAGDEAQQLARLDPLTGLGNRRAFDEALAAELAGVEATGAPLSLIVADLNGFKQINDRDGHLAGDDCLRAAAAALRSAVRDADSCFRWGGDEFAVLLPGTAAGDAAGLATRIREAVESSCRQPDGAALTIACGVAQIPAGATAAQAVAAADAALLELKSAGPLARA
jgi:diguanylate cyclase (GGDEF)-like protein